MDNYQNGKINCEICNQAINERDVIFLFNEVILCQSCNHSYTDDEIIEISDNLL